MTKRLSRYNTLSAIRENLPLLIGKKINIVTRDRRVFYVILDKFENSILYYRNMRLKKQEIALEEVAEIIYDY